MLDQGLKKIRQKGGSSEGSSLGAEGLNLMNVSIDRIRSAILQYRYSIWTEYAQDDIDVLRETLERQKAEWERHFDNSDIIRKIEQLTVILSEIKALMSKKV